ncbi:MAG TPA: hypothetical protein VHQ47_04000 [Phycisphaerae bacterium]|jgi:hypothetical protein|nr:hypothetical protein [Phycisphaerae bacterium]
MPRSRRPLTLSGALTLLLVGLGLLTPAFLQFLHAGLAGAATGASKDTAIAGFICAGLSLLQFAELFRRSRTLPTKEVMRLAEARHGLLTLSETATALDIDPDLALRTLQALSKKGIASQRWTEVRKNLWEFPDYMTLPIPQSIELAKSNGGRLSLSDLVSSGHSTKTARDTLTTLTEKGLAQPDPASPQSTLIITTQ